MIDNSIKQTTRKFFINLIARLIKDDILMMASSLSYYMIFATIPLLMVLINLSSFILSDYLNVIVEMLESVPPTSRDILDSLVDIIIDTSSSLGLSLGIFFAIWSASTGINKLITSINIAYGLKTKRKIIKQRIVSIFYTFGFFAIILFMLVFEIFNTQILGILNRALTIIDREITYEQVENIWSLFNGLLPFFILLIAFTFFYKMAPRSTKASRITLSEAMLGGSFSSLSIILISFIYSYFVNNISNMSLVYGTLAGFMALFIWIFLVSHIIIIGAEVIASYREVFKRKYFVTRLDK
ncbi:MAG: YihY/virulence factor BrkB family protein [Tissierellia bacterium]|nr:YihY/virulence factor BrkB family protein [Tissierellia bacterium]